MGENEVAALALVMAPVMLLSLGLMIRWIFRRPVPAGADPAQLSALMDTASRLERRIETLEMILDTEVPGWRSRSGLR